MKKGKMTLVALAIALAMPVLCSAQQGAPRRVMTMEEAVLGTGLQLGNMFVGWSDEADTFQYEKEGVLWKVNVRSGDTTQVNIRPKPKVKPPQPGEERHRGNDVYAKGNNVFFKDMGGTEHPITSFLDKNIVCGQSVSRNEFGIDGGIFMSPDSTRVAFYLKDESKVTSFPLLDITTRTGTLEQIKYPMNGMASEKVRVGVHDMLLGTTIWLKVDDFDEERYLTNVTWGPDNETLYIQVLDRAQKHMHLNSYSAKSGELIRTILTEENDRFVEPQNPLHFIEGEDGQFIYTTDNRDGYKNLYVCSTTGAFAPKRLTAVDADVEYLCQRGRDIFYYSSQVSPVERHLFKVDLKKGKSVRLTPDEGWHNCQVSADGKYFIDSYTSLDVPRVIRWFSVDGKKSGDIYVAPEANSLLTECRIEMGTVKSADGKYDNHYGIVYPLDFDPSKKYPVILYVYGGPHSQMISDRFMGGMSRWDVLMAQKGYVVFTMDNRGTLYHGAEYEKAIHRQCGKAEMEDQMEGMKWLMSHDWVDKDRIGVHGWSYGGFMTISLMVNYPEVFKVGVAGGPVIDWRWYEIMYGERYMETEETNPEGFASTSLIPRAKDLKGKLLICQGAIDKTVVWQHSLNFVEACIKEGVQVDYFPYPTHEHNVRGRDRVHLMQKVTDYFEDYLK